MQRTGRESPGRGRSQTSSPGCNSAPSPGSPASVDIRNPGHSGREPWSCSASCCSVLGAADQWFLRGAIVPPPRGTLAMAGDRFSWHSWGQRVLGASGGWRPGVALNTPPQHHVAPVSTGPSREPRWGRSASCLALLFPIRFVGSPMTHPLAGAERDRRGGGRRRGERGRSRIPGCDFQTL